MTQPWTINCTFCGSHATYKDGNATEYQPGETAACGNCTGRLSDPRAISPVSPQMAKQMAEMLTDSDESPESEEEE